MSKGDDNNPKVDSPPSYQEAIKPSVPFHDKAVGLSNSGVVGPLGNINIALNTVEEYLKQVEEKLKEIPQLNGLDKLQGEKTQELWQDFKKGFDKVKQEVKGYTDTLAGSPIKAFADERNAENYAKSPIGRLEKFAKEQLKKVEKVFEGPTNAVKNNPILNAVGNVIKSACHEVVTIAKGTLNNAIATGELAKNVVNLGVAIKNTIVGKGAKQATMGI